jgi:hypothetical protein
MELNTSSIHSLPSENIEMKIASAPTPPTSSTIDQETMNQIMNDLHGASSDGGTHLPSRDISQNTDGHVIDESIQPNYIPSPSSHNNYVESHQQQHQEEAPVSFFKNMDEQFYNEIQGPLLFAILYFVFQLPIVKKYLFVYLPFLFLNDGNTNLYGYVFTSICFGIICYLLSKTLHSLK